MTLRKSGHASLAGGPIMLRKGWPHDPAKLPQKWPHEAANRQGSASCHKPNDPPVRDNLRIHLARKQLNVRSDPRRHRGAIDSNNINPKLGPAQE
jgi:hypothetical protein